MDQAALWIISHEKVLRLCGFAGTFLLMALWEGLAAARVPRIPRSLRWPHNLGLTFLNTLLVRFLFPSSALGAALWASARHFGLLNRWPLPGVSSILAGVVLLDLVIYLQHRVFHAVPLFWKFHRMHHTDLEMDVTTGIRFHPVEMAASMLVKVSFTALFGVPASGVFLFEFILNASSLFSHSNIKLPPALDRGLRWLVVTPGMHLIHHSVIRLETDSNFGFNFSFWDRLAGTYRAEPRQGRDKMKIGLESFRGRRYLRLDRLLLQPWMDPKGRAAPGNLALKD